MILSEFSIVSSVGSPHLVNLAIGITLKLGALTDLLGRQFPLLKMPELGKS